MLTKPVTEVKGVGEKFAEELAMMNIHSIGDLLEYFPYNYNVFELKPLSELIHDDQVTIIGKVVHSPRLSFFGKGKSRLSFVVEVENVAVQAVMFNRAFAQKQIQADDIITLLGKWDAHRLQITVSYYKKGYPDQQTKLDPKYTVKGKVTNARLKKVIEVAVSQYAQEIDEFLPSPFLEAYKLPTRSDAVVTMHFPKNRIDLKHARRRFTYEEFLIFQLKMKLIRKISREATKGNAQLYDEEKIKQFIETFPFPLTGAQNRSLQQILKDMRSPFRMNRLLQGDVGSGKTAVASVCLYAALTSGKQAALMVPTEILAEQHFASLKESFAEKAKIELLTGSIKGKKRREILEKLENGDIDFVIGTHALIQDDVHFADLGLVIVDEQHRFGVEQRRKLNEKGLDPDTLFMTATPIPRTLAITAFGDMDVSRIDEMPANRKPVKTYWVKDNVLDRVLQFIQKRVAFGEQAYVICPLIEESDKLDIQNAVDLYHQLQEYYQQELNVGLMHGRLTNDEKEQVMQDFATNKTQVLISTTVVEVGVNVPNATVMVIYDAQRFGLSQLHQLRGRVGRGDQQSYCILIADPKGDVGKERMHIMTETNNGFELSERDLQLRGPGDFFGTKQSGLPEFKVADMVHDFRALEIARNDADEIIEMQLLEKDPAYFPLKKYLLQNDFFREKLD